MNIPEEIMEEILLLLPIQAIVMCKSTCKSWRHLISRAQFAKLHQGRAKEAILLHPSKISRMVYLIEPSDINNNYCRCNAAIESAHKINLKLDTKLRIHLLDEDKSRKRKLIHCRNRSQIIQNSCNGLLCLTTPDWGNQTVVCNPVTNEYIKLPSGSIEDSIIYSGFGFCAKTGQYKVLRIKLRRRMDKEAEIHTLGTNYWKSIGTPPSFVSFNHQYSSRPLYLNGVLYWYCRNRLFSFEFSSESFTLLPTPPIDRQPFLGKFRDSLSLSVELVNSIEIFVFGIEKSWSKLITIPITAPRIWKLETQLTSCCSKCEDFLVFSCHGNYWMNVFYPERKEEKNLRLRRQSSLFHLLSLKAHLYTPTFRSLKDVVPGAEIQPISTGLLLHREITSLYLKEDEEVK